ncbi:hypothetical protein NCS57_00341600 [Fusarium keratoplasticum]|uniref:Uncharacterized protein n=1 Tax=Fusarium keratoplasticum TaxID=1328300 RepID=A0ACC0R2B8_9HYPO|nr:hypothetical protein NCS57_00341600 [Fusarium keratoplasticum]KAI8674440.1 hypothetical protein NCS57_00341600 [Fusarium keratoplasticum]KAI8680961.1 hypothetical protein NCS55_00345200 [Fusarium keratoplasticum]
MKFSAASIIFLAHGIAAMPWSSGKANEDITLRIQVSQSPSHHAQGSTPKGTVKIEDSPICLAICWHSVPTCPDGWYSNNMGTSNSPCWTCCKAPEDLQL